MSNTRRILVYIVPVTALSFALNIPKEGSYKNQKKKSYIKRERTERKTESKIERQREPITGQHTKGGQ